MDLGNLFEAFILSKDRCLYVFTRPLWLRDFTLKIWTSLFATGEGVLVRPAGLILLACNQDTLSDQSGEFKSVPDFNSDILLEGLNRCI